MKGLNIKILESLDLFVFNKINDFKEGSLYQELSDNYNQFEEWQQGIVRAIMMAIAFVLPLLLLLIFYVIYSVKTNKLELTESIIHSASRIIGETNQLKTESKNIFGEEIATESILTSKLNSALAMVGIDGTKVKVSDFYTNDQAGVTETSAQIQFRGFSSENLYAFLQRLFITQKFKAREIHIEKNKNNQLLEGKLQISHFSKASTSDE